MIASESVGVDEKRESRLENRLRREGEKRYPQTPTAAKEIPIDGVACVGVRMTLGEGVIGERVCVGEGVIGERARTHGSMVVVW